MLAIRFPVRASNARTASMSATQRVSPNSAMPLGPLRVTLSRPPMMKWRLSITPSRLTRLMNPLPSFATGEPLMLETNQTSSLGDQSTDSGVLKPVMVVTRTGAAAAAVSGTGVSLRAQPRARSRASVEAAAVSFTSLSPVGICGELVADRGGNVFGVSVGVMPAETPPLGPAVRAASLAAQPAMPHSQCRYGRISVRPGYFRTYSSPP